MRFFTFVLLAHCGVSSAQTVSFGRPVVAYQPGSSRFASMCSLCVAVADFNGDGKPDIVYAATETIPFTGVVLGNGDGTFRPGVVFPGSQSLGRPVAADFNGDGKMDVVISGSRTWIYLGNGDGTFAAPIGVEGCSANAAYTLSVVGDFNRDGRADLICRSDTTGIVVLLSNGDGSFRAGGPLDPSRQEYALLVADFNHDGNPDVLLQQASGLLAVAPGHGDGTFDADLVVPTQLTNDGLVGVLAGDFNGDGSVDLAGFEVGSNFLDVLPGKGDGTFGGPVQTSFPSGAPGILTAAGDFNGDGRLDLVAGDAVLVGTGEGTFRFPVFFGTVTSACGEAVTGGLSGYYYPCQSPHVATVVADFNGDGMPDLGVGTVVSGPQSFTYPTVSVLLNDGPGDGFTVTGVSSASLAWPVAPGSIASAFGVNLAGTTAAADMGNSFPTTLGGIRVHVQDRSHVAEMLAPLLFVSPGQINYIMPSSDPFAFVAIERVGSTYKTKGMAVPIAPIAAGLYNAVNAVRVDPDGTRTYVSVNPIDVSGTSTVYLVLYGTGFSKAVSAASSCGITTQADLFKVQKLPVSYAGPEMAIAGLDQANVLLTSRFAGAGIARVSCAFSDGSVTSGTNLIQIAIQ